MRTVVLAVVLALVPAAVTEAATPLKHKLRPVCHRGESPRGKRHCVRAPRNIRRPRGHREQGGPNNLTPLPTSGGLGAAGYDREESAIAWAEGLRHDAHYAWYCEGFIENAFNESDKFKTAWAAAQALALHRTRRPPRGALVFFRPDRENRYLGHVGIALNRNSMISALDTVETSDLQQEYWRDRYAGWAYAPDDWKGRFLIPAAPDPGLQQPPGTQAPGGTQPPQSTTPAPTPTVQLTSPTADQTLTGTVTLTAHVENASGVEFDAYYADDPANVNTLSWHKLGNGSPSSGGNWSMPYDTHAIPDQGNPGWGTVNVMAIALKESGDLTAARDWHRVNISNPAAPTQPPPPPPPPPTYYVHHVVGTCAEGGCGLKKRAGPGYSNYAQVGIVYDGQEIDIVCQTTGQAVAGRNATSTIWDKLTDGSYVSDYYTDTPVVGGFSPPIPHC